MQAQHAFILNEAAVTKNLRFWATVWVWRGCRACLLPGCFYYVFPEYSLNYPTLPTLIKQSNNDSYPTTPHRVRARQRSDRPCTCVSTAVLFHTGMCTNDTSARLSTVFPSSRIKTQSGNQGRPRQSQQLKDAKASPSKFRGWRSVGHKTREFFAHLGSAWGSSAARK